MKKDIIVVLIFVFLISIVNYNQVTAANQATVELNGEELLFDASQKIINKREMVPVRKVFEEVGLNIKWVQDTQMITGSKDNKYIENKIDSIIPEKQSQMQIPYYPSDVKERVNLMLKERELEINLPIGVKSVAKHKDPQNYEELVENIENLEIYNFSVKRRSNWKVIALDQLVSNREDWPSTSYCVGVTRMNFPKYEKLTEVDFEGVTYNALYSKALWDNNFTFGLLVKDGEIIDTIAKTSGWYSMAVNHKENIYVADYLLFSNDILDIYPRSMKIVTGGDHLYFMFDNPFKK